MRLLHASGNVNKAWSRPEPCTLIGWPANDAEPSKYRLLTLPQDTPINQWVSIAHPSWRIERDHQGPKRHVGLGHGTVCDGFNTTT